MYLNFYFSTTRASIVLRRSLLLALLFLLSYGTNFGQAASGLNFDGINDEVTVPVRPNLNISSAITIEAWIFPTKSKGFQDVVSKSSFTTSTGYIFPRTPGSAAPNTAWKTVDFMLYLNATSGWQTLKVPYTTDPSGLYKLNQWHHLAATYDGSEMRVYIDGLLKGTKIIYGTIAVNNNPLTIGNSYGYGENFGGGVDEVRIFNRALSQCEIASTMNCELGLAPAPAGLAAYYKFNAGTLNANNIAFTQLNDETTSGAHGVLTNLALTGTTSNWSNGAVVTGTTCSAFTPISATAGSLHANVAVNGSIELTATGGTNYAWVGPNGFTSTLQNPIISTVGLNASGIYTVTVSSNGCSSTASTTVSVAANATSLTFNGINNYITIPHTNKFITPTQLSIETWILPTSASPYIQDVVSKSSFQVDNGYVFPRTDDGWKNFSFWLSINGQWKAISAAYPSLNTWHHVAATYDGFYMKIYLDGVLKSSLAVTGSVTLNTLDVYIGNKQNNFEYFKGGMDELRIWSRALSQCEIQNNYTCELNTLGNPNPVLAQVGLLAYYQFNQGLDGIDNSGATTSALSPTAINMLTDISGNNNNGSLLNFDLTGTSSNWVKGGTVNNNICTPYTSSTASIITNGPIVPVGSTITMAVNGGTAWSWSGPNSITSTQQNISIPNAQPINSGTYSVSVTGAGGCVEDIAATVKVAYKAGTLQFDGIDDQIVVPTNASLDILNTITLESWVYPTDGNRLTQDVMGKSSIDINTGYIFPRTDDGWKSFVFYLHINGSWQKLSAPFPTPALNTWNHLAASYDGYNMRIYLNGVLQASKQIIGTIAQNTNNLMIGQQQGYIEYFSGQLEEARIWNRALSQCELINNMSCELANSPNARNGLVGYYQFNQGFIGEDNSTENTLIDQSTNINNGSLLNFALSGTNSNWTAGHITGSCLAYADPGVTASANGSIFGIGSTVKLFTNHSVPANSYSWDGPLGLAFSTAKDPTIINAQTNATGVYTVTASYTKCSVMASTKVSINPLSPIEPNGPTTFCPSGSVSLHTPNVGVGFQWYFNDGINGDVLIVGATTNTYVATMTGNYTVTVDDGQNVLVSVPISILVIDNQPPQPVDAQLLPMTLHLPANNSPALVTVYPTAVDNCRGVITGTTIDPISFSSIGSYTINWKYDDLNGYVVYQSQQVNVIDITPPIVNLPVNLTVPADIISCGATVNFTATATDNSGGPISITYSVLPGSLFSVGTTTIMVTATDMSLNSTVGSFTVTVLPTQVAGITGTASVCAGATTILATTSTNGTWSSTNTGIATIDNLGVVTGVSAGTVEIRYTNTCGAFASLIVTVKELPIAMINAGNAVTTFCAGGSVLLSASAGTGYTYQWFNNGLSIVNATSNTFSAIAAGSYTATIYSNGCSSTSNSISVSVNPLPSIPTITPSGITNFCTGGSVTLTSSSATGNTWSTQETTQSIIVSSAGNYSVTVSNGNCVASSVPISVTVNATPSIPNVNVVNNCGSSSITASNYTGTILWSTNETTPSITVSAVGNYTVTQTVNGCISAAGSATATPMAAPSAPTVTVVDNCGSSTLTASNYTGTILWSTNETTPSITVSAGGNYTVTQTVNGCISAAGSATATPMAATNAPTVTVVDNCGSSTLTASNYTGTILWSTNETTPSITVSAGGNYTVTQTVNGCISAAIVATAAPLIVPAIPVITAVNNCGSTLVSTNATGSLLWSNNGGVVSSFIVSLPGTYTVTTTNLDGCSATSAVTSVTVNAYPIVPAITGNVNLLIGSTSQLSNTVIGGVWSSNSSSVSITPTGLMTGVSAGNVIISYTVFNNTCSTNVSIAVAVTAPITCAVLPVATITASPADEFCNRVVLSGTSSVVGSTFSWYYGSGNIGASPSVSLDQSSADGIYQLLVSANGCTSLAASYDFTKQTLANSYTILALEEIKLGKNNTVASGSIGVTSSKGEIELNANTSIASQGSFVKAKYIKKLGSGITIANPIYSPVSNLVLPTMMYNTTSIKNLPYATVNSYTTATLTGNYKKLTLKSGSKTTLSGNNFGSITIEKGAQVMFTAAIINIKELKVPEGPSNGYTYLRFQNNSNVLVSKTVSIGSHVFINPENRKVTFYMGSTNNEEQTFDVTGTNSRVHANIFMPNGRLKLLGGSDDDESDKRSENRTHDRDSYRGTSNDGDSHEGHDEDDNDENHPSNTGNGFVDMTGYFIAREVEGETANVIWNSFNCSAAAIAVLPVPTATPAITQIVKQTISIEKSVSNVFANEELKVTVMPNPSTSYFTLRFESKLVTPVNIRVVGANGRVIEARSKINANSTIQLGANYPSGTYYAEMMQGTQRKVVQLLKIRG